MSYVSKAHALSNVRTSLNKLVNSLYHSISDDQLMNLDEVNVDSLMKGSKESIQQLLIDFEQQLSTINR